MRKNFFGPLNEPLQKDPLLLCIMIIVGILVIGITYVCNSIPIIIILSLLVFSTGILAYCYIKNYIIDNQNKDKL